MSVEEKFQVAVRRGVQVCRLGRAGWPQEVRRDVPTDGCFESDLNLRDLCGLLFKSSYLRMRLGLERREVLRI
jgi:hypothetical protein